MLLNTPGSVLIPTVNSLLEVLPVTVYSPLYPVLPNPVVLRPDITLVIATTDPTDNHVSNVLEQDALHQVNQLKNKYLEEAFFNALKILT